MKRILKILSWLILILVGLILIAGLITQTSLFRTWLKDFALAQVNDILETDLSISDINGNLFNNLEIRNLLLSNEHDTLLIIPEMHLSYNLLALLDDKIEVHELEIIKPQIRLSEDSLGIWNYSKLIPSDSQQDTVISGTDQPFRYLISVDSLSLLDGSLHFATDNDLFPEKISQLNMNLNGLFSSEKILINLNNLVFQSEHPEFVLTELKFNYYQDQEELLLKNLMIKTGTNIFESNARYHLHKNNYANLNSNNLDLNEFEFILPDIKLNKNPDLNISSRFNQDSLEFEISIQSDQEYLTLKGFSENYQALFDSSNINKIHFTLDLVLNNLTLNHWSDHLPGARLSGEISIDGSLTGYDDLEADLSGEFHRLQLANYAADFLQMSAVYHQGDLEGNLHLYSKMADLDVQINIEDLIDHPAYNGSLSVAHLDLGKILLSDSLRSDLNFTLHFQGENIFSSNNLAYIESDWSSSQLNNLKIDTLFTVIHLSGTQYTLDTLHIQTLAGFFALTGRGDLNSNHWLNYNLELGNLQNVANLIGADSLYAQGCISGLVTGNPDTLKNDMRVELYKLHYNDFSVDTLVGKAAIYKQDSIVTINSDLKSQNIKTGAVKMDSIDLSAIYENDRILSTVNVRFDSNFSTSFEVDLRPDSILVFSIPQIDLNLIEDHWQGKVEKITYNTGNSDIGITDLNINCTTSKDRRRLFAEGILSSTGSEDFQIKMEGIHLKNILSYLGMEIPIEGRVSFNLDLSGTANNPMFKGDLRSEEGYIGSTKYQGVNSWFGYANDKFDFDFSLNFNGEESLIAEGNLPLHLSLTDTLPIFDPEKSLYLNIRSEPIPVELFFHNLKKIPEVSGTLLCDFTLKNTFRDPNITGQLQLTNGSIRSPYWGIDYKNIELKISALDDKFTLDKFQVISTEGNLTASGEIQFDYNKVRNKIVYSNLSLLADKLYLMQHKDFEIQISGDIKYQMEQDEPKISGYLDINRSSFYLPTLMDRAGYITTENIEEVTPVLVEAREKKLALVNSQEENTVVKVQQDTLQLPRFLDLVEGEIEIRITRNTWLRNPQLRLELGGNINMMINKGDIFLNNPVEVVRGQYDFFGRRFTVIQGKVDFQGARGINPIIYLEAEYVYRSVGREKKSLILKITGDIENPVITFLESNDEISQEDAISIILYGHKRDELSFGTQSEVEEMVGASAATMGIVSNIVSNQLTRAFSDDLNLDVIEVNATDRWQGANFIIGKYITRDIFVTYKREFGQSLNNNLSPETISMEYQIRKNLFLQLIEGNPQDSGMDLMFKFDWD